MVAYMQWEREGERWVVESRAFFHGCVQEQRRALSLSLSLSPLSFSHIGSCKAGWGFHVRARERREKRGE